jgi:hypothetical protein
MMNILPRNPADREAKLPYVIKISDIPCVFQDIWFTEWDYLDCLRAETIYSCDQVTWIIHPGGFVSIYRIYFWYFYAILIFVWRNRKYPSKIPVDRGVPLLEKNQISRNIAVENNIWFNERKNYCRSDKFLASPRIHSMTRNYEKLSAFHSVHWRLHSKFKVVHYSPIFRVIV